MPIQRRKVNFIAIDKNTLVSYIFLMDIVPQLVANSVIAGAIYALLTLGFNLIYGTTKFFNLAHGVIAAAGAYAVFALVKVVNLPINIVVACVIGIVFAGFLGWALDSIVYLPLRTRKASNMVLMVASLGAFTAIQAVIAILFTSQFQTLETNAVGSRAYDIAGAVITETQVIIIACGLAVVALLGFIAKYTTFGKAVEAIRDDEEVARMVGIDTNRIIGKVFFIGSMIAGLAGILIGFDTGIEPTMGMNLLLKGTIAAIIGGVGSLYGGFLGAFVLGFAENFGIWKISGEWKDAIAFVVLIVFLLVRPQGIIKR